MADEKSGFQKYLSSNEDIKNKYQRQIKTLIEEVKKNLDATPRGISPRKGNCENLFPAFEKDLINLEKNTLSGILAFHFTGAKPKGSFLKKALALTLNTNLETSLKTLSKKISFFYLTYAIEKMTKGQTLDGEGGYSKTDPNYNTFKQILEDISKNLDPKKQETSEIKRLIEILINKDNFKHFHHNFISLYVNNPDFFNTLKNIYTENKYDKKVTPLFDNAIEKIKNGILSDIKTTFQHEISNDLFILENETLWENITECYNGVTTKSENKPAKLTFGKSKTETPTSNTKSEFNITPTSSSIKAQGEGGLRRSKSDTEKRNNNPSSMWSKGNLHTEKSKQKVAQALGENRTKAQLTTSTTTTTTTSSTITTTTTSTSDINNKTTTLGPTNSNSTTSPFLGNNPYTLQAPSKPSPEAEIAKIKTMIKSHLDSDKFKPTENNKHLDILIADLSSLIAFTNLPDDIKFLENLKQTIEQKQPKIICLLLTQKNVATYFHLLVDKMEKKEQNESIGKEMKKNFDLIRKIYRKQMDPELQTCDDKLRDQAITEIIRELNIKSQEKSSDSKSFSPTAPSNT